MSYESWRPDNEFGNNSSASVTTILGQKKPDDRRSEETSDKSYKGMGRVRPEERPGKIIH